MSSLDDTSGDLAAGTHRRPHARELLGVVLVLLAVVGLVSVHALPAVLDDAGKQVAGVFVIVGRKVVELVTTEQRAVRERLESLRQQAKSPPTVDEILERVLDVEARITDDPTTAREAIRRMLFDGKIVMHPQPDGSYRAESVIFPLRLPKSRKPRNPKGSEASRDVVGNDGCAGAVQTLYHGAWREFRVELRRAA